MNKVFDVFISRKSEDEAYAKPIYDYLIKNGLNVFEAAHTIQELGNTNYIKTIDTALENTKHLIVIASSRDNITSSWVEAEWTFFLGRKRSGKTKGNLFTVICNDMKLEDVPASLQNYEIITFQEENFSSIYNYCRRKEKNKKTDNTLIGIKTKTFSSRASEISEDQIFNSAVIGIAFGYYTNFLKPFLKQNTGVIDQIQNNISKLHIIKPISLFSEDMHRTEIKRIFPNIDGKSLICPESTRKKLYCPFVKGEQAYDIPSALFTLRKSPRFKKLKKKLCELQNLNAKYRVDAQKKYETFVIEKFFDHLEYLIQEEAEDLSGTYKFVTLEELKAD